MLFSYKQRQLWLNELKNINELQAKLNNNGASSDLKL